MLHSTKTSNTLESVISNPYFERKKWISLPYLGRPLDLLAKELRRIGYHTGFYSLFKTSNLSALKDPIPLLDRSGVYRLTCKTCNCSYVGLTGRSLSKRIYDHSLAYREG